MTQRTGLGEHVQPRTAPTCRERRVLPRRVPRVDGKRGQNAGSFPRGRFPAQIEAKADGQEHRETTRSRGFVRFRAVSIRSNARACSHRRAGSGDAMSAEVDPQVVRAAKGMRGELGRCTPIWWRSCRVQTRLFVAFLRNWHRMRTLCGGALRTRR